jgi:hypothetical protein
MSNFAPTIGRNVQYIDSQGITRAAIIIGLQVGDAVDLKVFTTQGDTIALQVRPYTIGARASDNLRVYLLNWQGRWLRVSGVTAACRSPKPCGLSSNLGWLAKSWGGFMAKKKQLKLKRFYLSFELYTRGPKKRIPSFNTTFVPRTEGMLPDIDINVDTRDYGATGKIINSAAYCNVQAAIEEFAEYLKTIGEIE